MKQENDNIKWKIVICHECWYLGKCEFNERKTKKEMEILMQIIYMLTWCQAWFLPTCTTKCRSFLFLYECISHSFDYKDNFAIHKWDTEKQRKRLFEDDWAEIERKQRDNIYICGRFALLKMKLGTLLTELLTMVIFSECLTESFYFLNIRVFWTLYKYVLTVIRWKGREYLVL